METNKKRCPVCGGEEFRQGKLHGVASLQGLEARSNLGGSRLIFTFCADCGEVTGIRVEHPEQVK